jgi:type IV secretory pathway TrbD component
MADIICGAFIMVLAVALIAAGYCVHMWHILREIAREDAKKQADKLFNSYVKNCEYRVITSLRIVDEMGHRS